MKRQYAYDYSVRLYVCVCGLDKLISKKVFASKYNVVIIVFNRRSRTTDNPGSRN